jgi:hypothetical protein
MDNIERNNESQHQLYTKLLGGLIIQEPDGWSNDIPSFKRDKSSRGILSKTEIDLEFYGDGADWLSTVANSFGIQETVLLIKSEKDVYSINEKWRVRYIQEIDMGTYVRDKKTGKVTVKATEGGLYDKIKKRKSKKYDLVNTESADGDDIGAIKTYPFQPQPRDIFLQSFINVERPQLNYRVNSENYKVSTSDSQRTIPLIDGYTSDTMVQKPSNSDPSVNTQKPHDQQRNIGTIQPVGDQFIFLAERAKTIRVKINLKFRLDKYDENNTRDDGDFKKKIRIEFRKSQPDDLGNIILVERDELLTLTEPFTIGALQTVTYDQALDLEEGDSFSCVFSTAGTGNGSKMRFDCYFTVEQSEITIEDSTPFRITTGKCMKPFDLFERLVAKITGKNGLFKSTVFGAGGEYEHMVVDNGFWARGFPNIFTEADGEERTIQFNSSWKDAFESYNYLEPLCWFTEISGKQEVVRIEKATHTMKNFIGVRIPSVDKVEEKTTKQNFFSGIKIGHKKSLEYEEINGLDEPNGLSEYGTPISKNDTIYMAESMFRFDSVGYELVRRRQYTQYPKEDTPRDKDIFMHDAKYINGIYYHNLWTDKFDSAPTGIFSPDTAWNLWLSPMNRLFYGHGYSIKRGLYHFPTKSIRFDSSNSNQNLKTIFNGLTLHEGGSVLVDDLEKPRIEPMEVEVTFHMTQAIEDQIRSTTRVLINDVYEEIPNYFGLFEYIEGGNLKYGRLVKLDASDEGKLTLINVRL